MSPHFNREIIQGPKLSELEKFASFFHQDADLLFNNFYQGTHMYLENISEERKLVLKRELTEFIEAHDQSADQMHENSTQILQAWFKLGAESWDPGLVMKQALLDVVAMLNGLI